MKKLWVVIFVGAVTTLGLFADQPAMPGVYKARDSSSINIAATYGSTSVVTGLSTLNGKTHIAISNGCATKIAFCVTSQVSDCSDCADEGFVPASGAVAYDFIAIGKRVCLRSTSGTLSSGIVDIIVW